MITTLTTTVIDRAFAALGDSVRLRIGCCLLMAPDGLCVCELVDVLGEPQPNVSRQLKLLKEAGLVTQRREGRWAYYALRQKDHPLLKPLTACLEPASPCGAAANASSVSIPGRRKEVRLVSDCPWCLGNCC